jgi:3-isopropylmalate/(R)-2-methylmalate dehydratase large subunit
VPGRTVIDRIWADHVVAELGGGRALLHIDRVLLHERTGPALLAGLAAAGRRPAHAARVVAIADHTVPTEPGRSAATMQAGARAFVQALRDSTAAAGVRLIDLDDPRQGIVHVVAPELGLALPGMTLVCPDSHTGTLGGLGALAWGIGSTEGEHAVATQTLVRAAAPQMRVRIDGALPAGSGAKDIALALIARFGATGGALNGEGCAIEFTGSAVRALSVEGRMTLCNLAVEFGAWTGLVAPDERTIAWVAGRPHAPQGADWESAVAYWRTLRSDDDATWDAERTLDVSALAPQLTWGTSPEHGGAVDGRVPDPAQQADPGRRAAAERALGYMGLRPGQALAGLPIDAAFIGSCTNARLPDLREAAQVLRGRKVAPGVRALVVPGSMAVRAAAEADGLHRIFIEAGFEWRASGCSLCFYSGNDSFGGRADGAPMRVASSTNRNFEGRQGPGVRTHLCSPATVAASAVAGALADPRPWCATH